MLKEPEMEQQDAPQRDEAAERFHGDWTPLQRMSKVILDGVRATASAFK